MDDARVESTRDAAAACGAQRPGDRPRRRFGELLDRQKVRRAADEVFRTVHRLRSAMEPWFVSSR